MIGRRRFLQLGPIAMIGPLGLRFGNATGAAGPRTDMPVRGIIDGRFAESRDFAASLASHGVHTTEVCGDVAGLWYDDLRPLLRGAPAPFAGLTDRAALFCLEELARDVGMKVEMRIDHLIDGSGNTRHEALGPASCVATIESLRSREPFGYVSALLVIQHALHREAHPSAQKRTGPAPPRGSNALVTWVIA